MSLSAERIAVADRAILQAFERSSVAWQAIPHWDVGDRGRGRIRRDKISGLPKKSPTTLPPTPLDMKSIHVEGRTVLFAVTLAQATAGTPDALLSAVLPRAVELSRKFDRAVLKEVFARAVANGSPWYRRLDRSKPAAVLDRLVKGRRVLEEGGFTSPSCLIASTTHFTRLSRWVGSNVATEGLLTGANANSLYRASYLDDVAAVRRSPDLMIMLGRNQEIAHGAAASASPGEEPVDVAVSVPPSLEVVGENAKGQVQLAVRMRFATRVKDARGVVVFHT